MERMIRLLAVSCCATLMSGGACTSAGTVKDLVLEARFYIEGEGRFQPSGLALYEGRLWTVSDKHGLVAYRLELDGDVARAVGAVLDRRGDTANGIVDFDSEGLVFHNGALLIASEEVSRVFRIVPDGGEPVPVTPDLSVEAADSGMFVVNNAGIEAFTILEDGTFVVGVERQPRGIIEVDISVSPALIQAQAMDYTRFPIRSDTPPDFAGLTVWKGRLFALARNQSMVVELVRGPDGKWTEGDAWSYASVENDPEYRYQNRRYGLGEGLAIDDMCMYVVFDNNDDGREADPSDNRPQLFIFENPYRKS